VATARERLLQALNAIISQPCNDEGKTALKRLLNSYRVQAKPGEKLDKNQTARDLLAARIVETWQQNNLLERKNLNRIISSFRMQLKQGLNRGRTHEPKNSVQHEPLQTPDQGRVMTRSQIKENTARQENAYFKNKQIAPDEVRGAIPIAGGPKQGTNSRGQCPKCRSFGIVLARAYGGDDYYSCIYCGFQSYLKGVDPKLDLPLAAELLGRAFGDPENEDDG
jgi:hypothetical protein